MALSRPISCTSRSIRRGPLVTPPCDRRAPWQWSIRAPTVLYIHVDDDLPRGMCHNHCCRAAPHCAAAAAPARMPLPDNMATCVQYFRCQLVSSWFSFIARSHACHVRVCGTSPQRLCASCASAAMRGHLPERVHLPRPSRPRTPPGPTAPWMRSHLTARARHRPERSVPGVGPCLRPGCTRTARRGARGTGSTCPARAARNARHAAVRAARARQPSECYAQEEVLVPMTPAPPYSKSSWRRRDTSAAHTTEPLYPDSFAAWWWWQGRGGAAAQARGGGISVCELLSVLFAGLGGCIRWLVRGERARGS